MRRRRYLIPLSLSLLLFLIGHPVLTEYISRESDATKIKTYILSENPEIASDELDTLLIAIFNESRQLKLPANMKIDNRQINRKYFITALIAVESSFRREAVSRANARGYMQLMPDTVAWMDYKYGTKTPVKRLFDTRTNIKRGVTYLNYLTGEFNTTRHICLAYNAGPGSLRRGFYIEEYWKRILRSYRKLNRTTPSNTVL